jgi:hypothetical protein
MNIAGAGAGGGLITCQKALVALNAEPIHLLTNIRKKGVS